MLGQVRCAVRLSETNRREQKQARRNSSGLSDTRHQKAGQKLDKRWTKGGQKVVILGDFLGFWDRRDCPRRILMRDLTLALTIFYFRFSDRLLSIRMVCYCVLRVRISSKDAIRRLFCWGVPMVMRNAFLSPTGLTMIPRCSSALWIGAVSHGKRTKTKFP